MLKLVKLVITVSAAAVPARLKKFSVRLDEVDPLLPPRGDSRPGVLVYENVVEQSIDEFVAKMEATGMKFVLAWYEPKPDPQDPERIYHNLVYIWADKDDGGKVHQRFAPVRPAIRAELNDVIVGHTFKVRRFYDNQFRDLETGGYVEGVRRWDIMLGSRQQASAKKPKSQLPFPEPQE